MLKRKIFALLLIGFISNAIGQNRDSFVYYNSMQTKVIIKDKSIYSFYNKKGQLLLRYNYAVDQILIDSIDKSKSFYTQEMDSNVLKAKYDVPPTINFSDCYSNSNIHVHYPPIAVEENVQGQVVIQIKIDKYGNVTGYSTIKTIGYNTDLECIKKLRVFSKCWFPAIKNGHTVDSEINFTFNFLLE